MDDEKRKKALELAERIAKATRIRVHDRPDNQSLLCKVALLYVGGKLCDADIQDAIEAVDKRRPDNRIAYFQSCINNALGRGPGELNRLLAGVTLGDRERHIE